LKKFNDFSYPQPAKIMVKKNTGFGDFYKEKPSIKSIFADS